MVELNGIYYLYFLFSTFVLKLVKPYKFEVYNKKTTIDVRSLKGSDANGVFNFSCFYDCKYFFFVAMVSSVSASCVRVTPSRFNSSSVSLQASALAIAVMEAVNSHEFTKLTSMLLYEYAAGMCSLPFQSRFECLNINF